MYLTRRPRSSINTDVVVRLVTAVPEARGLTPDDLIPLRQARPSHAVIYTNEHERDLANEQASNDSIPRRTKFSFLFARNTDSLALAPRAGASAALFRSPLTSSVTFSTSLAHGLRVGCKDMDQEERTNSICEIYDVVSKGREQGSVTWTMTVDNT